MSSDVKHEIVQSVSGAISSPEVVKTVTLIGGVGNLLLWVSDHANLLVAVSTLVITWSMFYYNRKKAKQESEQRDQELKTEKLQQQLLEAKIKQLESSSK